jgi:uncharacterized protein YbbC (DUF1343 family)
MKILNMKLLLWFCLLAACGFQNNPVTKHSKEVNVGAENIERYLPLLKDKRVAVVANQTSQVKGQHIVDLLLQKNIQIKKIFSPEHGFRGKADAGEVVNSATDQKTGLPIISLYGKNKKPKTSDFEDIDIVVFDIQDVGVRFYTYISTLHYVLETCAETNKSIIVLDRPNPNAHYIDGPLLKPGYKSFIGMHPVPVVYGMTIGEYAQMIVGEEWLDSEAEVNLTVIPCQNYNHNTIYELPIKPSPNLPNLKSILLYPSLCFFEGTEVSIGRGTDKQFQVIGSPITKSQKSFSFTPKPNEGAKYPKLENNICYGDDLSNYSIGDLHAKKELDLSYLIEYHNYFTTKGERFFLENLFIDKLAGTSSLRIQIESGLSEADIKKSWQKDLETFKSVRSKYLIY